MNKNDRLALPGDVLASGEEYLAGEGTYEEGGKVRAALVGCPVIDEVERTVTVVPKVGFPRQIMIGDTVIGMVTVLKNQLANIRISAIEGTGRPFMIERLGTVHISNVDDHFITDLGRCMKPGDIVRARVVQVTPSIQLSTRGADLGVVKGRCGFCLSELVIEGDGLSCPNCRVGWQKKVSTSYGTVNLLEDR